MASENKLKHLEFIQNTITRMSTNSFIIKGWAITIITALFAFSAKESNTHYAYLAYFVTPLFWYLNSFFLLQERRYRELYNDVREINEDNIDFAMDASIYTSGKCAFYRPFFGVTIWPLYFLIIIIATLIIFKL
jgi:4-amino-4-deoxy-L-arabinose transferase-like glycosyltransferase